MTIGLDIKFKILSSNTSPGHQGATESVPVSIATPSCRSRHQVAGRLKLQSERSRNTDINMNKRGKEWWVSQVRDLLSTYK